jgi:hypothetical protein
MTGEISTARPLTLVGVFGDFGNTFSSAVLPVIGTVLESWAAALP